MIETMKNFLEEKWPLSVDIYEIFCFNQAVKTDFESYMDVLIVK